MKRLLFSAAMFLCCMATSFAQFTGPGAGTESDPYKISNPIQLNQLRYYLNQSGVYFKLTNNIDLTEFLEEENPDQGWQPVGNSSSACFKGILDGDGHKITGLWIKRGSINYVGFFGYTDGATIKNVAIEASTIEGNESVGGVSGSSHVTTISGCSFTGTVKGSRLIGGFLGGAGDNVTLREDTAKVTVTGTGDCIGGFIGRNDAGSNLTVSGCVLNDGIIRGVNKVGGCCGENIGTHRNSNYISNTYIHASIYGADYVGGICGLSENSRHTVNLSHCGFVGEIIASSHVGGLVGKLRKTDDYNKDVIQNCFAIGSISAIGNYSGGLIGYDEGYNYYCYANLSDNYHSGPVTGANYVGGLVGYKKYGEVSDCYAIGSVAGGQYVGGLLGYQESATTIKKSVAINTRVTATTGDVNRVVGYNKGTIGTMGSMDENRSYNKTIVISQGVAKDITDDEMNGTGVSATTLKLKATYVAMGWDFTDTWAIQETECYPYMQSQTAPPVIQSQVVSGATTVSGKCVDGGTITLEIDGVKQQMVSTGHNFSFTVSPLQAGHEVRVSAKADGKEQSYFTTEVVSFLGKGTESDPYQISTAADLTQVFRKGYYKLMNDIDLTDYINQFSPTEGWQSIGRDGSETIHFNGDGHKITGLWCNSTRDNTGLFSCFANGNIKNLTVETASGKQVKGGANTGILIGKMINGTIENCKVVGKVADGTPVGGIVGLLSGGSISQSQAIVTISTTGENTYVGGIVGEITSGTVDQCVTTGTLTATGATSYVGGVIGKNSATATNCYSTATITSSYNAAGIVAYNYGVVDMCYATGNLYSNNYAAGVVGYNDGANAVIRNCVAMNNKIEVVYESQQVLQGGGYGQRIIGGIKNNAPVPEMNNYALKTMQVSLNDIPQNVYDDIMNGTAKTIYELKQKATYQVLGWDFTDIWKIDENESYPYQTVKVDGGSDPVNPDNPTPDDPTPDDPQGEIEVTDVSTINNVFYIDPMEEMFGTQATISLKMKNTAAIRGFQFDLYLPEGVTVAKSSKGKILGALSEGRLPEEDEHQLTFSEQPDGAIRFLCSSQYDETFTGNDGEIATLQVNIGEEMKDGDYAIDLKNVKLTETDISKYYLTDLVRSKLTVMTYILGDINNDNLIDVSDYTGVANHIHGNTPEGFNMRAADVDESGNIDVSDYTGIANIIHTGSIYGNNTPQGAPRMLKRANTNVDSYDNVIYITPFSAQAGEQVTVSLKMKNTADIRGFQFDLYLPEGVTVAKSNKGRIQGALSAGRLPDEDEHELTFSEQPDGAIRFLCSSQYDETFTGNDGEIATLQVNIGEEMKDGDYAIDLKNVKLTETDISKYYLTDLVRSKLTVMTYILGDINNDNLIDVSDYTGVANHIHGNTPEGFNMRAADVDESGNIDVSDYTGIANIIHTGSIYGNNTPQGAPRMLKRANTNVDSYDNVIYITPFSAQAGEQVTVSLKMKNTADIRGFQFDLYLPEGVTVAKSNKGRIQGALSAGRLPDEDEHELTFSEQPDGAIRFLCSSQYDETFTGNDGELATLKVNIAEDIAAGDYPILLKNMKLTETDISKFYTTELIESTLTVTGTSGIDLTPDSSPTGEGNYYTLDGQKLNGKPTQKGVYIQNGKKIIVK